MQKSPAVSNVFLCGCKQEVLMKFREFRKKYKRDITKLLTTHFALAIFSIMCTTPFFAIDFENSSSTVHALAILVSLFVFAFYYYLVHIQMWNLGATDKLAADGGRLKLNRRTGLYLGLLASIPSFIINIIYLVSYYFRDYEAFRSLSTVSSIIEIFWDAHALGLRLTTGSPWAYLTASILPALFAGLAYFLGTHEFRLFGSKKATRS